MPMPPSTTATDVGHFTGMRNTHSCPKCRSTVILRIPGKSGAYGVGNNIPVGWSNFSAVLVDQVPVRLLRLQRGVG
jgi:hypothetical protein